MNDTSTITEHTTICDISLLARAYDRGYMDGIRKGTGKNRHSYSNPYKPQEETK